MNDFIVTVNNKKQLLKVVDESTVIIDDKTFDVELSKINEYLFLLKVGNKKYEITATKLSNDKFNFLLDGNNYEVIVRTALKEKAVDYLNSQNKTSKRNEVIAPMPGLIVSLKKKIGDDVKIGDSLLTLEAMKMENDLRSPASGIIKSVNFEEGENVEKGSVILIIG